MRLRWYQPMGVYRTKINDAIDHSIHLTIKEVLPGETVHPDDPFLAKFVHYTELSGFMAFNTKRTEHPVMVQVHFFIINVLGT